MNYKRASVVMASLLVGTALIRVPLVASLPQSAFVEAELLVRLTMELPVEIEVMFDAWTTADQLVEWFPSWAEMTVTEGGEYRFGWDGWEEEWVGNYIEVDRPEKLVFSWLPPVAVFPDGAYETTVMLSFEDLDGATQMTLEHSGFQGGPEMESHKEAWSGYLYNLRAYLLQR
jgi:uncharacterized protein YndB with AHSA1/START domain